jgi:hypothetical protein
MDTSQIVKELKSKQQRVEAAIAALQELNRDSAATTRPGAATVLKPPTPHISAAGRARIAAAARERWAKIKSSKGGGPTPKRQRVPSAAARKKMAAAAKARWAKRKAAKK